MNNIDMIQKQIKTFNKALSRADKANLISDDVYAVISDMIDPVRMTKSGYGKAGTKYLASMTTEELLSYSSDIQQAKDLLELDKAFSDFEIENENTAHDLLWRMYQKVLDNGFQFDSDDVHMVDIGAANISAREMAIKMNQYLHDSDYGLSDFREWFDSQNTM